MKTLQTPFNCRRKSAMTVIEMTVVLAIMMVLATVVVYSASGIDDWKKGKNASMILQRVYLAQKSYLADHPTTSVTALTASDLLPYLQGDTTLPTIEPLEGSNLPIAITVMPPVAGSAGTPYDPSDTSSDGLWDVGAH